MSDFAVKFRRSFPCGGVGSLVISANGNRLPLADFHWSGPRPPFVETIEWAKDCFEEWATKFDRRAVFLAISPAGFCEFWEFVPGERPKCLCLAGRNPPLRHALRFARTMMSKSSPKADYDKNSSPIGGAPQ